MKIVKFPINKERNWSRTQIDLKKTPLKKSTSLQISELTLDRNEPFHTNKKGYVLCVVIIGWMQAYCQGKDYKLKQGEGIIFSPAEKHRINKGKGWMLSISSIDYDELQTLWENNKINF